MVRSAKTWASSCQGALLICGAAPVYWWSIDQLLLQGHGLVPVKDVLGVGIPNGPVVE